MKKVWLFLFVLLSMVGLASATIVDRYNIRAEDGAVVYIGNDYAPLLYSNGPTFSAWGIKSISSNIETFKGLASLEMVVNNVDGERIVFGISMKPKQILQLNVNRIEVDNTGTASYWKKGQGRKRISFDNVRYNIDRQNGLVSIIGECPELDFEITDMIAKGGLVDKVRQLTKKYRNADAAVANGFFSTVECVESPMGVMGIHYINPALFDCVVNELEPETLLYVPTEDGFRLVGVEYFIPSACVSSAPRLFGREMDGPMPGHGPGQPEHYDLHAFIWEANPSGIFEEWNPNLSC